jgi:hypothetical protein
MTTEPPIAIELRANEILDLAQLRLLLANGQKPLLQERNGLLGGEIGGPA